MNSKGLSESMHVIILFAMAFLVILILLVIVGGGAKNARITTDPSTGFDIPKEDFCNKACANDNTGNCGGPTNLYETGVTCRQHLDSILKRLEVTYTPSELKTGAETLTITVKDFKTKATLNDAVISATYYSGTQTTAGGGLATLVFIPANIPKTGGIGNIEGTVKLAGYPDANFNVLVRE